MPITEAILNECSFLSQLNADTQSKVVTSANSVAIPKDTQIFDEGDPSAALALVVSGSIRVFKRSQGGREVTLYRVNKENLCIVTLSCLMGGDLYPATGCTEEATVVITLPKPVFINLVATDESFREITFNQFGNRISGLMQLIDEITFNKLDRRLADYLLINGPVINRSHQDIADELGSVREMVSRLLKQFETSSWIQLGRGIIEVTDTDAIIEFVESV
jgi:CRP/FNR family transcriptional regulator